MDHYSRHLHHRRGHLRRPDHPRPSCRHSRIRPRLAVVVVAVVVAVEASETPF